MLRCCCLPTKKTAVTSDPHYCYPLRSLIIIAFNYYNDGNKVKGRISSSFIVFLSLTSFSFSSSHQPLLRPQRQRGLPHHPLPAQTSHQKRQQKRPLMSYSSPQPQYQPPSGSPQSAVSIQAQRERRTHARPGLSSGSWQLRPSR